MIQTVFALNQEVSSQLWFSKQLTKEQQGKYKLNIYISSQLEYNVCYQYDIKA